jgi:trigger factor
MPGVRGCEKATTMQVTETQAQGLKREFKVVFAAAELAQRLDDQLADLKGKVRINGFRQGKVPISHLKRVYGRSVMADIVKDAVDEANRKIVDENSLRLAGEPKIDFSEDQGELQKVFSAEGDLAFVVNLEVLPKFEVGGFEDVEVERFTAEVSEDAVANALQGLIDRNRPFVPKEGSAAKGDKVTIDFVGAVGGEAFERGSGNDVDLVLGSGTFLPGFEDQLEGIEPGGERLVKVTFPENYGESTLAGKEAEFQVTCKAVQAPGTVVADDTFAKGFGYEDLDKLKEGLRASIEREYAKLSRERVKRALLDALDKKYAFDLPAGLVDQEFESIWRQAEAEQKQSGMSFSDEGTTEEAARVDYRKIAERRVRLGLVLAEVGEKAGVKVSDDEMSQALYERVRQFPGQEKEVWEYLRKNQEALAQIRAPLYEEKVVDHILSTAKVTERSVSPEELAKLPE